ncbi:MAG: GTP-binding protein, partial [Gallionellaceae bacterium]
MGVPEKIKAIQDEMAKTQINKATEHHIGLLRAKLAKLRREQEDAKSKKGGSAEGFD